MIDSLNIIFISESIQTFPNESFAKRLKNLFEMSGYEVNFVDHEANCISNFMWDDSIYDTLTVLIGFCNNEEVVKNRIFDIISMDCSLNDDFFAGSLLYFSYNYQTKLFNSNEHIISFLRIFLIHIQQ